MTIRQEHQGLLRLQLSEAATNDPGREGPDAFDILNGEFPCASVLGWLEDLDLRVAVLMVTDEGLRIEAASRGWIDALGLSQAAVRGRRLGDVLMTEACLSISSAALQARSSGKAVHFVTSVGGGSGSAVRIAFTARAAPGLEGRVILEMRPLPPPPRTRERDGVMLFNALNLMSNAVVYVYELGRETDFDMSAMLGYPRGHPATQAENVLRLLHPDDAPLAIAHHEALAAMPDGQFSTLTCRMRHIDGRWRWIEIRERVFGRTRSGKVRRILGLAADVTEQRRMADSLAIASRALLTAEAEERRRIARELHDSTAQHLVAMDLTLTRLERRTGGDPDAEAAIHDIRRALTAAHREVRTFSYLLHPPDLEQRGFEATLVRFLDGFGARTGLDVRVRVAGARLALEGARALALFRVAQEALMNVHRHAGAARVEIALTYAGAQVQLEVRDDGVGMAPEDVRLLMIEGGRGVGIAGMKARVEELGGALELQGGAGGLTVRARIPAAGT